MENNNEKVGFFKRSWVKKTLIGVGSFVLGLLAFGLLHKREDENEHECKCLSEPESVEENNYELEETNFETVEDDK